MSHPLSKLADVNHISTTTQPSVAELNEQLDHPSVEVLRDACHAGNLREGDVILWQGQPATVREVVRGEQNHLMGNTAQGRHGIGWTRHFRNRYFVHFDLVFSSDAHVLPVNVDFGHCWVVPHSHRQFAYRAVLRNDMVVNLVLPPHLSASGPLGWSASPPHFLAQPGEGEDAWKRQLRGEQPVSPPAHPRPGSAEASRARAVPPLPRVTLPDDDRHNYLSGATHGETLAFVVDGPAAADLTALPPMLETAPVSHFTYPHVIVDFDAPGFRWSSGVFAVVPVVRRPDEGVSRSRVILLRGASPGPPTFHLPSNGCSVAGFIRALRLRRELVEGFIADNHALNTATALHLFCDGGDVVKETDDGLVTLIGGGGSNYCYGAPHPLVVHRYEVDLGEERVEHVNTTVEAAPQLAQRVREVDERAAWA